LGSILSKSCRHALAVLILAPAPLAFEDVQIGTYVGGGTSNTAPVAFGEIVRVDFFFQSDGIPAVGAYNLLLRWDHARLRFAGIEFGDGLGSLALGEATVSVVEIGENPHDPFWWATFGQTTLLGRDELRELQPTLFRGATALFEVIDPSMTILGGAMGFGRHASLDNYVRSESGQELSFNCCSACPLPQQPEITSSVPPGRTLFAQVGQPIEFTVTATDGDDLFLNLTAAGTPRSADHFPYPPPTRVPVTTTFRWIPSEPGITHVRYRAADASPFTEDALASVLIVVERPTSPAQAGPGLPPYVPWPFWAAFSAGVPWQPPRQRPSPGGARDFGFRAIAPETHSAPASSDHRFRFTDSARRSGLHQLCQLALEVLSRIEEGSVR